MNNKTIFKVMTSWGIQSQILYIAADTLESAVQHVASLPGVVSAYFWGNAKPGQSADMTI